MTGDDKTETPIPGGQLAGGILMAVGALAITVGLALSLSRPAPQSSTWHGTVLFLGFLIVVVGLITYAASTVICAHHRATERAREENAILLMDLSEQVQSNNEVLRQLTAAPTVRLHEARQLMGDMIERVVGVAKAEAVREIGSRVDGVHGKVDELQERFMDLEADLASFRVWQKQVHAEPQTKINGNGKAIVLRSVPSQPE